MSSFKENQQSNDKMYWLYAKLRDKSNHIPSVHYVASNTKPITFDKIEDIKALNMEVFYFYESLENNAVVFIGKQYSFNSLPSNYKIGQFMGSENELKQKNPMCVITHTGYLYLLEDCGDVKVNSNIIFIDQDNLDNLIEITADGAVLCKEK